MHVPPGCVHSPSGQLQFEPQSGCAQATPFQPGRHSQWLPSHVPCTHGSAQPDEQSAPLQPAAQRHVPGATQLP